MDNKQPLAQEDPSVLEGLMQQLIGDVQTFFEQQQQLKAQFVAFQIQQQQILNQQQQLLDALQRIFTALSTPHLSSSHAPQQFIISFCISVSHKHSHILDDSLCYAFWMMFYFNMDDYGYFENWFDIWMLAFMIALSGSINSTFWMIVYGMLFR